MSDLYIGMTLKSGMDEKNVFIQTSINEVCALEDKCKDAVIKLTHKLAEMTKISKGLPRKRPSTAMRKKEHKKNDKKANNRRKRLDERIAMILKKLGRSDDCDNVKIDDIDETFFKTVHRRFDIHALTELLRRKVFLGDAARKVHEFLNSLDSSDESENEGPAMHYESSDLDSDDDTLNI